MIYCCPSCSALGKTPVCSVCSFAGCVEVEKPIAALKASAKATARKEPDRPMKVKALRTNESVPRLNMNPRGWGRELPRGVLVILRADPGAGKSTFLLHTLSSVKGDVLYVCSEESVFQVADRATRIGASDEIRLFYTRSMFKALDWIQQEKPDVAVIDSLNACTAIESNGENASLVDKLQGLAEVCIKTGTTVIVISHVNKDGDIYGPTTLEHASDVNMYIKVDPDTGWRTVGSDKNRFHATGDYDGFRLVESGIAWAQQEATREHEPCPRA